MTFTLGPVQAHPAHMLGHSNNPPQAAPGEAEADAAARGQTGARALVAGLKLLDGLEQATAFDMPTRRGVAAGILSEVGIDPERRVRVNHALVPDRVDILRLHPLGNLVPASAPAEVPVLPLATEKSIAEEYVERDGLTTAPLMQLFGQDAPIAAGSIAGRPVGRRIDAWVEQLERETGADLGPVRIEVMRGELQAHAPAGALTQLWAPHLAARPALRLPLAGTVASLEWNGTRHAAWFADSGGGAQRVPAGVGLDDWLVRRFGENVHVAMRPRSTLAPPPESKPVAPAARVLALRWSAALSVKASARKRELLAADAGSRLEIALALARMPASLARAFEQAFDRYRDDIAAPIGDVIDAWLELLAILTAQDLRDARITIERVEIDAHRPAHPPSVMLGTQPYGPAVFGKKRLPGYFIVVRQGGATQSYYLPFARQPTLRLPDGVSIEDWVLSRKDDIFGAAALRLLRAKAPGPVEHTVSVQRVGEGGRHALAQWLPAGVRADIDRDRAEARGMTAQETLKDALLNLIPFRAAHMALGKGDFAAGVRDLLFDLIGFIPAVGASLRFARTLARAGAAAWRVAGQSVTAGLGARAALRAGAAEAARHAPRLASQAVQAAQRALDGALPVSLLEPGARPRAAGTNAVPAAAAASNATHAPAGMSPAQWLAYRIERPAGLTRAPHTAEPVWLGTRGQDRYIDMPDGAHTWVLQVEGGAAGWHVVPPGKPGPRIPVRYRDGAWRIAEGGDGLPGGAPAARALADPTRLKLLDDYVMTPFARAHGLKQQGLRVSGTLTVVDARRILDEATDVTYHRRHMDLLEEMIHVEYPAAETIGSAASASLPGRSDGARQEVLALYRTLYDRSPTFRALFNRAAADFRISPWTPWTVQLQRPVHARPGGGATYRDGTRFDWIETQRLVLAPPLDAPPAAAPFYLSLNKQLHGTPPARVHVHLLVHGLTGYGDPPLSEWRRTRPIPAGGGAATYIDTRVIKQQGFADRGAVEYLTHRILDESGVPSAQALTSLPIHNQAELEAILKAVPGAYQDIARYTGMQDLYLAELFPFDLASASALPAP